MPIGPRLRTTIAVAGVFLVYAVSAWHLRAPFSDYAWHTPFHGLAGILPVTAWAAFKVWTFWGLATALAGLIILQIDAEL